MNIITIEQARAHCKTDAVDDDMLTIYANAAEKACANLANRALFVDQAALDAAILAVPAAMSAAFAAHASAVEAAASLPEEERDIAESVAAQKLFAVRMTQSNIIYGIPVDADIIAAILLTTAHFYRNREEVVVGSNAAVNQLPIGAERIMRWYRRVGAL